jgi:hypothetical protein
MRSVLRHRRLRNSIEITAAVFAVGQEIRTTLIVNLSRRTVMRPDPWPLLHGPGLATRTKARGADDRPRNSMNVRCAARRGPSAHHRLMHRSAIAL